MKLHINNLSPKVTDLDLSQLFGQYGPVLSIEIDWRRIGGRKDGMAVVEMNMGQSISVAREWTGRPFHNRRLYITLMGDSATGHRASVAPKPQAKSART